MENNDSQHSEGRTSNLDVLPGSKDGYWQHAEIHTELAWQTKEEAKKEIESTLTDHYFMRIPGHQAQCTHCNWGFQLDWGDKIKDGHLYNKDGEFVI